MTPSALAPVSPQKPHPAPRLAPPWIAADVSARQITDDVMRPLISRPGAAWLASFAYEVSTGVGVWGLNKTVGWAFDITNFVFWIGIGHAGTLISAILLLLRQQWRTAISRSAE